MRWDGMGSGCGVSSSYIHKLREVGRRRDGSRSRSLSFCMCVFVRDEMICINVDIQNVFGVPSDYLFPLFSHDAST